MAYYGLSNPWMARLNEGDGTYKDGFKCGEAVGTTVTPSFSEASLYGDNKQTEAIKRFKNAAVAATVTRMPLIAKKTLFGHEVEEAVNEETSKSGDAANYVGYGFISAEYVKGSQTFIACFLPKVIFSEGEESYETQGDSIVFKTPVLAGLAIADDNGMWREKKVCNTEEEADKWLQMKINKIPQCDTPVASITSGVYSTAQSVTLTATMQGVTIKYTTDGTTPSVTNGTLYNKAIAIAATTGLRAIAYKANCLNSDIKTEEYFIETL